MSIKKLFTTNIKYLGVDILELIFCIGLWINISIVALNNDNTLLISVVLGFIAGFMLYAIFLIGNRGIQ